MIASSDQRCPRRRAQRGGVELRIAYACLGDMTEAVNYYHQALETYANSRNLDGPNLVALLTNIAEADLSNYAEGLPMLQGAEASLRALQSSVAFGQSVDRHQRQDAALLPRPSRIARPQLVPVPLLSQQMVRPKPIILISVLLVALQKIQVGMVLQAVLLLK